jgi:hypothetical protein
MSEPTEVNGADDWFDTDLEALHRQCAALPQSPTPSSEAAERGEQERLRTGRQCGSCSLCCYVYDIHDPQLTKQAGEWCPHARPGKGGCAIHANRPQKCRNFYCQWLVNPLLDESWYPLRSKIVVAVHQDVAGRQFFVFKVDPRHPDRWRLPAYRSQISQLAVGYPGSVVRVGRRTFAPRPHNGDPGPDVFMTSRGQFKWIETA